MRRNVGVTLGCCLLVSFALSDQYIYVGEWGWNFYADSSLSYILGEFVNLSGADDGIDGWFHIELDNNYLLPYGGVSYHDLVNDGTTFKVFKNTLPGLYSGVQVTTTLRLDDSGFAIVLWQFHNPGTSTVTLPLSNYGDDDRGSDSRTVIYDTSSGDTSFTKADSWFVSFQSNFCCDPVLIGSFGEANYLDYAFSTGGNDIASWYYLMHVPPGETLGFLAVLGGEDYFAQNANYNAYLKAVNVLSSGSTLYNYVTPSGNRLLSHLTDSQLIDTVNWNFHNAGIGGDPHGVHFDGSEFELPNSPEVYCLYSDHVLQVNTRVGKYGFIKEVVVFVRPHGLIVHSRMEDEHPVYFVDSLELEVPHSRENGLISTHLAPFNFKRSPLNHLEHHQESSLLVRNMVTIVGGNQEKVGGFFNVAVHRQSEEVEFPSVLQLPFHPLRDLGFSASVISDVWFDLLQ